MTAGSKILAVVSDILLTAAFFIGLYLLYQLYWTAVPAYYEQKELAEQYEWDMPDPDKLQTAATPLDYLPCDEGNTSSKKVYEDIWGASWKTEYDLNWKEPKNEKDMIGRAYIARFGGDYVRNLVQGTDKAKVLDRQGFGHYENTAMVGCVGNFSSAAHRDGYGAPLGDVETLRIGDALVVRTRHYWYVYKVSSTEIVDPGQGDVINPVPRQPTSVKPTERMLTYTTCHPRWSMDQRFIVHGKFSYWAEVKSGVPQELLDVGTKVGI